MKLTSVLRIRSLLNRLHPPLPPKTPRESEQLLSVLQSAFKRQLDDAHPPPTADASKAPSAVALEPPNSSVNAAEAHLHSILHHPLLITSNYKAKTTAAGAVALFNYAIVEGTLTLAVIEDCARRYRLDKRSLMNVPEAERLGPRLVSWYNLCDPSTKEGFLTGSHLFQVIPVMYKDGLERLVWDWLKALYQGDFGAASPSTAYDPKSPVWQKHEARLVHIMIQESFHRNGLAVAIGEYDQAWKYWIESGRQGRVLGENIFSPLLRTASMISYSIIKLGAKHSLSSETFDLLLQHKQVWSRARMWQALFLPVYHPRTPSADALYESFRYGDFQHYKAKLSSKLHKLVVRSTLDGAQNFLDTDQPAKAQVILDGAREHFPDLVPQAEQETCKKRIARVRQEIMPALPATAALAFG